MNTPCLIAGCLLLAAMARGAPAESPWRPLLDEKLSAWEVWMGSPHDSVRGLPAGTATSANARSGPPMGLGNDPKRVFSVRMEAGEPVLHITGEIWGALTTRENFSNYDLRVEVQWGERKWEPRLTLPRNTGLLYHATGPHGAFWHTWKRSLEFEIAENDMGDLFPLGGTRAEVVVSKPPSQIWIFDPVLGERTTVGDSGLGQGWNRAAHRRGDFERPHGEWNVLELYTIGNTAVHVVNGKIVNVIRNTAVAEKSGLVSPLERGQLQLQSESAEVFFRRIQIRPIAEFPLEIKRALEPRPRMAPASAGLPALPAVLRDETSEQSEGRLAWFREARFGMFIHWGVYAVPAGSWNGKPVAAEWIMNRGKIPVASYRALARNFTAAKYDPQGWAQLAEDAGVRYVVITAKHHDGFALFDSAFSNWNAVKASGARRDLIQPLADAVRGHGMKFGTYYSQSQDWINPGGGKGNTAPWDDVQKEGSFDEYLKNISLPQVRELVTRYHPDILWWDTEYSMTPERARPFFDLVVSQPKLIQNSRLGGGVLGDFRTSEQRIPASAMLGRALEVNMTINRSWGYRSDDLNWKSAQQLIRNLSDVASKDGNYLLNIGPTAEGVIPGPEVERLRAIGRWMKVNGDAIYGTRGALYAQPLPWGRTTQKIHAGDGATLYLHVWDWPADGKILVPGVQQAPRSGRLLATGAAIGAQVVPEGIMVSLTNVAPDPDVSVIALEFAQPVQVRNAAALPTETGASGTR